MDMNLKHEHQARKRDNRKNWWKLIMDNDGKKNTPGTIRLIVTGFEPRSIMIEAVLLLAIERGFGWWSLSFLFLGAGWDPKAHLSPTVVPSLPWHSKRIVWGSSIASVVRLFRPPIDLIVSLAPWFPFEPSVCAWYQPFHKPYEHQRLAWWIFKGWDVFREDFWIALGLEELYIVLLSFRN